MKTLSLEKILFLFFPFVINYLIIDIISGRDISWARGGPISNRVVSVFFLIVIITGYLYYFYKNRNDLRIIKLITKFLFVFFWIISLLIHIYHFFQSNNVLIIILIFIYLIMAFLYIQIVKNFKNIF